MLGINDGRSLSPPNNWRTSPSPKSSDIPYTIILDDFEIIFWCSTVFSNRRILSFWFSIISDSEETLPSNLSIFSTKILSFGNALVVSSETAGEDGALRFSPRGAGATFGGGGKRFCGLLFVNSPIADDNIA
jgi:hypothetical protein